MYARNNSLCYYQGEALNGKINARKSAAPKMEIPMAWVVYVWTWLTAVMFHIKTN